ncbi:MAG: YbjN domain-containing protein [Limimaricola sp.]|uniref:YbjN domain-containing protein n=1 Tax=Limimaricola sp. TaxID=2211665 RepID=UPI001DD5EFF4|nr:YbjN domain-containing protein [Limimaricola sp.]MBI1418683.1 YbjN domain-containing protein [Limimaricola sp.]
MRYFITAAALAATTWAGSAAAQNLVAAEPASILAAMQNAGFVATLGESSATGNPKISSRISRTNFSVYFYGCRNHVDCTSIQFSAGYNLSTPMTPARANEWNRNQRFAKVYVNDDGDPILRMDMTMEGDGTGPRNFGYSLDFWRLQAENFEKFIDW